MAETRMPLMGEMVHYRSRTGNYTVPAVITATRETLFRPNVEAGHIPDITTENGVHLTVFTPGAPGKRAEATDFVVESEHPRQENVGGLYQEWDIPQDSEGSPGTWRYF